MVCHSSEACKPVSILQGLHLRMFVLTFVGFFVFNELNLARPLSFLVIQGGSGHAHGMKFVNARMNRVQNPVVIDQFYCDSATPCANKVMAAMLLCFNSDTKRHF